MEKIDFSLILSIIAILGSLYTYIIHDRKIKAQEKLINDYQIAKIDEEKQQKKQALIRASIIKGIKGQRTLKVYNKGKATAQNIRLIIKNEPDSVYSYNPFPCAFIHENDHVDLNMTMHMGSPDNLEIEILWDDENALNNKHHQIIHLI